MSRIATRIAALAVIATIISIAACNDITQPAGLTPGRAPLVVVTPGGTLDQNVTSLLGLFKGNGALAQWKNVKRKYSDGLSSPQQMVVCKQMLLNLIDWVNKHSGDMDTPPGGDTREAAAARAVLYMSMYVYTGPTATPPVFTPAADVAVGIVQPTQGDTIVTPAEVAGIGLEAGSVAEPTVFVITQNPTPYPANCSGPLQTKLCQYPRFYKFDQFPHVKLLKTAKVSVCHINGGTARTPLADHDRFRLAHTLPANLADTTPGGTVRNTGGEAIEILPLVTQTFVNCGDVEFTASGLRHSGGTFARLARAITKFFTPTTAYAIDQGYGGGTDEMSDFNDVDPQGAPDRSVQSSTFSGPYYQGGTASVTYTVKNTGTATGTTVPVNVIVSPDTAFDNTDATVATAALPSIVPGDSVTQTVSFVIPAGIALGAEYIGIQIGDDPALAETDLTNNKSVSLVTFQPPVDREITFFQASPGPYHTGDHATVNFRVKNFGAASGAVVPVKVMISPDTIFDPTDITVATAPSPVLAGGDSIGQVIGFVIPPSVGVGSRFVGVVVGDDPVHPEADLSNNHFGDFISFQVPFLNLVNKMSVGAWSACALSPANLTLCWGDNATALPYRQYGNASVGSSLTPVFVGGPSLVSMGVGSGHFHCGINSVNTGICWGRSGSGQIPNGTAGAIANNPTTMAGGISWRAIKASRVSGCGVSVTGAGYCWGLNQRGEIGSTAVPLPTPGSPGPPVVFSVITITTTPHLIDGGFNWKSVVAGWLHACGITVSGDAYCWGDNQTGQLGVGTIDTVSGSHRTPALVSGGHHWIQLALGTRSTCGITDTHQAYCWGENGEGQLGNGSVGAPASVPMLVASALRFSFISVSSGFGDGSAVPVPPVGGQGNIGFACALTERGEAYCWGWNGNGSLGDGTAVDHSTPVQVLGGHIFTNLAAGGSQACGAFFNQIWCWGSNFAGQLGNGTTANMSSVPLLVASPFNVP